MEKTERQEIVSAEVSFPVHGASFGTMYSSSADQELSSVKQKLEQYTCTLDRTDYALAVACGVLAGTVDALYVGQICINENDIALSHQQVNNFIQKFAKEKGIDKERLKDSISGLEKKYQVAQDNIWKGAGIGVSAKNHHLADLAHHPTPAGLVAAIAVQFLRLGVFINKDGEWHFQLIETSREELVKTVAPAVIVGILNWIACLSENEYSTESEKEIPEYIRKVIHLAASTPMLIEIIKCADNWFGHLVSDMGGSKNTAGHGMGIPGVFLSMLYEIGSLPGIKDTGLLKLLDNLYENNKLDLRHELPYAKALGKQAVPVILNEILVRTVYFLKHLCMELNSDSSFSDVNWNAVIPFGNRNVDRMITVSSMTFNVADTVDAAVRSAAESAGNWVVFAGKFCTSFNYVGAGRAALAVVKEISDDQKEAQLLHEKRLLTEQRAAEVIPMLQEYKKQLETDISEYFAEELEAFLNGFDEIDRGIMSGDSNAIIKGNVTIQRVLGRAPQFTDQEEFDDLMLSDTAFQL